MKHQDQLKKAIHRIETEGKRHSINIYAATGIVWGLNTDNGGGDGNTTD